MEQMTINLVYTQLLNETCMFATEHNNLEATLRRHGLSEQSIDHSG